MNFFIRHKHIKNYMTPNVRVMDQNELILDAIKKMMHYNISCIVVTRDGMPVGIVTERDIMRNVAKGEIKLDKIKLKELMSSPLIYISSETTIDKVILLMRRYNVRRFLIIDNNNIKGIITQTDIVRMSHKYIVIIDVIKVFIYIFISFIILFIVYLISTDVIKT